MDRSIRDFERNGTLPEVISASRRVSYYADVDTLAWIPTTHDRKPMKGQAVIACMHNGVHSWLDVGYYYDGMLFDKSWEWANEFSHYDAWMAMPLPLIWKGERTDED